MDKGLYSGEEEKKSDVTKTLRRGGHRGLATRRRLGRGRGDLAGHRLGRDGGEVDLLLGEREESKGDSEDSNKTKGCSLAQAEEGIMLTERRGWKKRYP